MNIDNPPLWMIVIQLAIGGFIGWLTVERIIVPIHEWIDRIEIYE